MTAQGTKAERSEMRRGAALSAAIIAANWLDRPGKGRPTPERRRKGSFVLADGDGTGVTLAVNEAANMLDKLRMARLITETQAHAGHDLAQLLDKTRMLSPLISCLDIEVHGHTETDRPPSHGELRDIAERKALTWLCGPASGLLRVVVVDGRAPAGPGNLGHLRGALDRVARFWQL